MIVTVFVHAVDTGAHPSVPPGWRWAAHLGSDPSDLSTCLNAGWCPTRGEAGIEGEAVGTAVVRALRMCGLPAVYAAVRQLEHDPIPPGHDQVQVM